MSGPLPNPQARRRNAPTIPTTELPLEGRKGRPPAVPKRYTLGVAGKDWWKWAWKLPQATKWDAGAMHFVARRAVLEDMAAAIDLVDNVDLVELLQAEDDEDLQRIARNVEFALGRLKSMAGGAVTVMKEMRELDNRLGLNPKAMADLRWSVAAQAEAATEDTGSTPSTRRLRAV